MMNKAMMNKENENNNPYPDRPEPKLCHFTQDFVDKWPDRWHSARYKESAKIREYNINRYKEPAEIREHNISQPNQGIARAAAVLVLVMSVSLFSLTGCSLARSDMAASDATAEADDRLIGVLITEEYLDLFDMDSWLEDNIDSVSSLSDGSSITADGSQYEGRLYATLTTVTYTDEASGENIEAEEYRFEDVTGWAWFHPTLTDSDGSQTVWASGNDVFTDTHMTLNHTDDGTDMTLEGTICLVPDQEEHIYYVNPVYQDSNGDVYAISGNGYSTGTPAAGESEEREYFTVTLTQTASTSTDSVSTSEGTSVTIHMIGQYAPTEILLLQMAEDNTILSRVSYAPGTLPEVWTPEEYCSYLIVETHRTDSSGGENIYRELLSPEDESFLTCFAEEGICISQETKIEWGE